MGKKAFPTYESKRSFYLSTYLCVALSPQPHEHWSFQTDYSLICKIIAMKLSSVGIKEVSRSPRKPIIESGAEQSPWHMLLPHKYSPTSAYANLSPMLNWYMQGGWYLLCSRLSGAGFKIPEGEFVTKEDSNLLIKWMCSYMDFITTSLLLMPSQSFFSPHKFTRCSHKLLNTLVKCYSLIEGSAH